MSVQVDRPITGKLMPISAKPEMNVQLPKLTGSLNFDTVFGVATMLVIWGSFFVALTQL